MRHESKSTGTTTNMHIHKRREREASRSLFFQKLIHIFIFMECGLYTLLHGAAFWPQLHGNKRAMFLVSQAAQGSLLGRSLEFYYLSEPESAHATHGRERNKNAAWPIAACILCNMQDSPSWNHKTAPGHPILIHIRRRGSHSPFWTQWIVYKHSGSRILNYAHNWPLTRSGQFIWHER